MNLFKPVAERLDSWLSVITGLGSPFSDKTRSFVPVIDALMPWTAVQALMQSDDIAYRGVTATPGRALKDGFSFSRETGLEDENSTVEAQDLLKAVNKLNVRAKVYEADCWGRAYGLGGIFLGVTGAGLPDEPLDDDNQRGQLEFLTVVDRRELIAHSYFDDVASPNFGEVETYEVVPTSWSGTTPQLIHASRIIRFGGALTSRRERIQNGGCDYSVLQRVFRVLQQANGNWAGVCALMSDMSQGVYTIKGLMDGIAAGNEAVFQKRIGFMDAVRSVTQSIVLDADRESFERKTTPMGGVNEVLDQTWKRVAAAFGVPLTVLMGVSPGGLNATGESDILLWYDDVQEHRETVQGDGILRIAKYVSRGLGQANPDQWVVVFPNLKRLTASEEATYRLSTTQADDISIKNGTLLPEEVALARYSATGEFSGALTPIDADARQVALKAAIKDLTDPPPPVQLPPAIDPNAPPTLPPATE